MSHIVQDVVKCFECGGMIDDDRKQWASQCSKCVSRAAKHLASLSSDRLRVVMEGNRIGSSPNNQPQRRYASARPSGGAGSAQI